MTPSVRVSGKKLAYACDVSIYSTEEGYTADGWVRVGPVKGALEARSVVCKKGTWHSFEIQSPTFRLHKKYERCETGVLFYPSVDREPEKINGQICQDTLDPLALIMKIHRDFIRKKTERTYQSLSGSKIVEIKLNLGIVTRKGKTVCRLTRERHGVKAYLETLKLNLEIKDLERSG